MLGWGAMAPVDAQSDATPTTTPIKHLVVIFQENVSFDHYFATYPYATNAPGGPAFHASRATPSVNGLTPALLTGNPNSAQPVRLDRSQAMTCDMDHGYAAEQRAANGGLMNRFVEETGASYGSCDRRLVMDYYDGNTVTALWNYAQHFAMNDNSFGTTFGPSTPGALNLVAGQTHGAVPPNISGRILNGTVYNDLDPTYDDCSKGATAAMIGRNVGDLLNAKHVTWGWFEGGFRPTSAPGAAKAECGSAHVNVGKANVADYIPHHQPFEYYQSTMNPHHLAPTSVAMIGQTDQANHQYDLIDFWAAAQAGRLPAVSFVKAPAYQDGHAGYSDPIDEQHFLVDTINRLMRLPAWSGMAVIINYDDSDGWYDHVLAPVMMQSAESTIDALLGPGMCGKPAAGTYQGRCGYGPRLPLLVISPWARVNFVDHTLTDQSSILRFIEDNWDLGRIGDQSFDAIAGSMLNMFAFAQLQRPGTLFLDPETGAPVSP
ncbi:MAG TPA: alkaline phosphatase family protein [bacterium]|nr:alkaline phosphatase family protein [bacterium]